MLKHKLFNIDTFKHFKTDEKHWEMVFEHKKFNWSRLSYDTITTKVVGDCYTGVWRNKQPCFRHVTYDSPPQPAYRNNEGDIVSICNQTSHTLSSIYRFHKISEKLVDVQAVS